LNGEADDLTTVFRTQRTEDKMIGTEMTYTGKTHSFLTGQRVRVLAVIKGAARSDYNADQPGRYIIDADELAAVGGVTADDLLDVQPWIAKRNAWSFASSDAKLSEVA
jgi:hypothetical protein